jgi:large subunit ribosomal protein L22e
MTKTTNAKVA